MRLRIYKSKNLGPFIEDRGDIGCLEVAMAERVARSVAPVLRRIASRLSEVPGIELRLRASVAYWTRTDEGLLARTRRPDPSGGRTVAGIAWQNGRGCFGLTHVIASTDDVMVETVCALLRRIGVVYGPEDHWPVVLPLDGVDRAMADALRQARSLLLLGLLREVNPELSPYAFLDPTRPLAGDSVLRDLLDGQRSDPELLDAISGFYRLRAIAYSHLEAREPHVAETLFVRRRDPKLDDLVARITGKKK